MATLGEFLKSVRPYAKSAQQIYDEIHYGPGTASLDEATRSSAQADQFQADLMSRITSLKSKIQSGWQGQSADSATNAAEPLRQHARFNGQQLQQASASIANQSYQFNATKGQVDELPVNPDDESFFTNAKDFFTGDLVAKAAAYGEQVNANTQAYDRYYNATGDNVGALPSEYPPLNASTSHLTISKKPSSGDAGGLGDTSSGLGSGSNAGAGSGASAGSPSTGAGSTSTPSAGSSSGSASGNIGSGAGGAHFKPHSPSGTHSSGYSPAAAHHDPNFKPYTPSSTDPSGTSKGADFKPYSPHSLPSGSYSGDLPSGSTSSAGFDPGSPAPGGLGTGGFSGASYGGANSPSSGGAGADAGMVPPMMGGVGTGAGAGEGVRSGGGFGSRGPGAFGPQNPGGGAGAAEAAAKGAAGSGAAGGRGGPGMMGGAGGAGKGKKDDEEHSDEYYVDQDFDDGLHWERDERGEKLYDESGHIVPPPVIGE